MKILSLLILLSVPVLAAEEDKAALRKLRDVYESGPRD